MVFSSITESCLLTIDKKVLNKYGVTTEEYLNNAKKRFIFIVTIKIRDYLLFIYIFSKKKKKKLR